MENNYFKYLVPNVVFIPIITGLGIMNPPGTIKQVKVEYDKNFIRNEKQLEYMENPDSGHSCPHHVTKERGYTH